MSCALASPTDGVCANKRPVQGRRARPAQATLTPLAAGHARVEQPAQPLQPAAQAPTQPVPFAADAPESTFSLSQLEVPAASTGLPASADVPRIARTVPSYREIRAGRATRVAAAARPAIAEVVVPVAEAEGDTLLHDSRQHATAASQAVLPGMDQLVERVRQRTAARLSRTGSLSPA